MWVPPFISKKHSQTGTSPSLPTYKLVYVCSFREYLDWFQPNFYFLCPTFLVKLYFNCWLLKKINLRWVRVRFVLIKTRSESFGENNNGGGDYGNDDSNFLTATAAKMDTAHVTRKETNNIIKVLPFLMTVDLKSIIPWKTVLRKRFYAFWPTVMLTVHSMNAECFLYGNIISPLLTGNYSDGYWQTYISGSLKLEKI